MRCRMFPLAIFLLAVFSFPAVVRADLVAQWTSYTGEFLATSGTQTGSAQLVLTPGGGSTAIVAGDKLRISGDDVGWSNLELDLLLAGVSLPDFELAYELARQVDGTRIPPTTIQWAMSVDGGGFAAVGTDLLTTGGPLRMVSFSEPSASAASSLVLRATFSGASGPDRSLLVFDNLAVTAIPEPSAFWFLGMSAVLGTGYRCCRRRRGFRFGRF